MLPYWWIANKEKQHTALYTYISIGRVLTTVDYHSLSETIEEITVIRIRVRIIRLELGLGVKGLKFRVNVCSKDWRKGGTNWAVAQGLHNSKKLLPKET